jgi:lipoteichoic acid synthase
MKDPLLRMIGRTANDPLTAVSMNQVPFFLWLPGSKIKGEVSRVGGQLDIGPTLLYLLGVPPPRSFLGTPLIGGPDHRVAVQSGFAVGGGKCFLPESGGLSRSGCYGYPHGERYPIVACEKLRRDAAEELKVSDLILRFDLAQELSNGPPER